MTLIFATYNQLDFSLLERLLYDYIMGKNMSTYSCPSCSNTENREWGKSNGYTLVRCDSCGLISVFPMPIETADIYNETYFASGEEHGYVDYDRDKEPMRRTLESYLERVEQELGRKGKLLDVGCATGYFMDIARKRGWEVEGVEISEYATGIGNLKGLTIHAGILESINLEEKSFDVVTLFDVVEHLMDPKSAIMEVKRLLKKGGIIAVLTPDAGSLWARVLGKRWNMVVPPEHLVLFNRKNFGNLLTSIGLTPILVTNNIGKRFTLPYIFQTLSRWQGLSIWNMLARITNKGMLSKLQIPINLHDNFFMIAKKK